MQSKDIVMQVSEETAKVMEEISEQLLEESADLDEVVEAIEEAIKKVENLYTEFTGYVGNSNKQQTLNHTELMDNFTGLLDVIEMFRKDDGEQAVQSNEKLDSTLNKLVGIEKEIRQINDATGSIYDTLQNHNEFNERLLSSVNRLKENDEKILNVSGENGKKADELGKQTEENAKLLFEKMDDISTCLDAISRSVQTISQKQDELFEKQADIEKDVQYLKLPFFKKWFTKG